MAKRKNRSRKRKKKWYEVDKTNPTAIDLWREQKEQDKILTDYGY